MRREVDLIIGRRVFRNDYRIQTAISILLEVASTWLCTQREALTEAIFSKALAHARIVFSFMYTNLLVCLLLRIKQVGFASFRPLFSAARLGRNVAEGKTFVCFSALSLSLSKIFTRHMKSKYIRALNDVTKRHRRDWKSHAKTCLRFRSPERDFEFGAAAKPSWESRERKEKSHIGNGQKQFEIAVSRAVSNDLFVIFVQCFLAFSAQKNSQFRFGRRADFYLFFCVFPSRVLISAGPARVLDLLRWQSGWGSPSRLVKDKKRKKCKGSEKTKAAKSWYSRRIFPPPAGCLQSDVIVLVLIVQSFAYSYPKTRRKKKRNGILSFRSLASTALNGRKNIFVWFLRLRFKLASDFPNATTCCGASRAKRFFFLENISWIFPSVQSKSFHLKVLDNCDFLWQKTSREVKSNWNVSCQSLRVSSWITVINRNRVN